MFDANEVEVVLCALGESVGFLQGQINDGKFRAGGVT